MRAPTKLPPIELVEATYSYNPNTGELRKNKTGNVMNSNDRTVKGHIKVRVGRVTTQAARIAWLLFYREDPVGYAIEHIDKDPRNNRISNLRKVKRRFT